MARWLLFGLMSSALTAAACSGDSGGDGSRSSGVEAGSGSGRSGTGGDAARGGSAGELFGNVGGSAGGTARGGVGGSGGSSGDETCATDAECDLGQSCNPETRRCEIGSECGQSQFEISKLPPNMMILLDRSGSMDGDAEGDTRWNVAKNAIEAVTSAFDDEARFGLATYSACLPGGCSAGTIVVPIAANNAAAIDAFLSTTVDQRSSDGQQTNDDGKLRYLCDSGDPETSTGKSLTALVAEASLQDPARTNAVVLLTDGEESDECADDCDGPCGAEALLAQSPSVKTYVIGLGVNADAIEKIAVAGDTERAIEANNLAELSNAFDQVAAAVASCDYALDTDPPDATDLYVFFNDDPKAIERSTVNGWSYEPATRRLQFNGTVCDAVKSGTVTDIDVVYGCPQPTVD